MSRRHRRDRQRDEYGQSWEMAAALWDGPRTIDEIVDHFRSYVRFLGLFSVTERLERHDRAVRMVAFVRETLEDLIERGWVVRQGERYALTEPGRKEANTVLSELRETGALLRRFVQPQTASQVSLGVHLALAALKLPAGLLSGSVGLINDATDTLLDGLSSLMVYAGLRFDKERAANVVLVLLMLVTGGITFYEAVQRFLVPFQPEVGWFTFLAAILSALVCLGLWAYQRFVGLRSGSMALITQSVDSRNHVIVAASVTAGLVASLLRFPLLDTLVGLAVAVLILKSAVELAIELVRSLGEEEVDLSRYEFGIVELYGQFRQTQLRDWMLYLVEKREVQTHSELVARAHQALDFSRIPTLRALGLAQQQPQAGEMIEQSVAELFERGWLVGDERLGVTDVGREQVSQGMRGTRGQRHRLSAGESWHDQRPFDHAWGRRRTDVGATGGHNTVTEREYTMANAKSTQSVDLKPRLERSGIRRLVQVFASVFIIGALLFLSAGRLDWPEAWILSCLYLAYLLALMVWGLGRDPGLMNERGKRADNVKGWDKVLMAIYVPILFIMPVIAGLDAGRFGWSSMPLAWQVVGLVGFIPAMALPWWAMSANTYLSTVVRIQDDRDHQVATTGPYQYVRHPTYVGTILFGLCIPLFLGSWWALIPGGLIVILFLIRTALEDRTLQNELPGYADYAQRVRYRLLPGVW